MSSLLGKNIKFKRGESNGMQRGRIYRGKKGKGKRYPLPYNMKAFGKNIKRGRAGDGNFGEENHDFHNCGGKLYTTLLLNTGLGPKFGQHC